EWLKANNLRGFIGEHGVPDFAPSAMVAMDNLLTYLRQNCIPMTYWAAGPWWGEYVLSLDTKSGSYRPQLPVLKKQAATAHSCSTIGPMKYHRNNRRNGPGNPAVRLTSYSYLLQKQAFGPV